MALVKCEECGKEISDEAESCPSCGAKPEKKGGFRNFLIAFVVLIGIGTLMQESKSPSPKPVQEATQITEKEKQDKKDLEAKYLSILLRISALREEMKNPPSFELVEAISLKNGMLCVTYRGTNGFGGVVTDSKAINGGAKIVDYATNCNGKTGEDVSHLKRFLKKL